LQNQDTHRTIVEGLTVQDKERGQQQRIKKHNLPYEHRKTGSLERRAQGMHPVVT